jgi:Protein of unknown function (DUF1501)
MFTIHETNRQRAGELTRREWLRIGGLGAFGLSLPGMLQARQAQAVASAPVRAAGKAKACILLYMNGGPPQHETWDPKPDQPREIRGDFGAIATSVPGFQVGELMPELAKLAHEVAVLRGVSMSSPNVGAHAPSGYTITTGQEYRLGGLNDQPSFAAVYKRLRPYSGALPAVITLPERLDDVDLRTEYDGQQGGFLGPTAAPWTLPCDPAAANFKIPAIDTLNLDQDVSAARFDNRKRLLEQLDKQLEAAERSGALARQDKVTQQAFDLIRGSQPRQAFDLTQERPEVRDRYGRNKFGQSVLLARRLIEAGVPMIQVSWPHSMKPGKPARWDTHVKNAESLKRFLMPPTDQACAALLEDLAARGLLDETLVIWMGEFGRAPNINADGGRDHWVRAFSVALAGGGVRGGQVYGATDKMGGSPRSGQVGPKDLLATIYHCLGLKADAKLHDALGRPVPIYQGEVIRQILE